MVAYSTRCFLNSSQPQQQELSRFKFHLPASEPEIFVRLERNGKGGAHRARFHKVREIYIDYENRIHAGFKPAAVDKKSNPSYQYVTIGKLEEVGF